MAAFNGCLGTVYADSEEILGIKNWEFSEEAESEAYRDNTTGCNSHYNVSGVETTGSFSVNLQTGATKGKLPLRARDRVTLQLHIDDTGDNYFEQECIITSVGPYSVSPEDGSLVTCDFSFVVNGRMIGHGTLSDEISS